MDGLGSGSSYFTLWYSLLNTDPGTGLRTDASNNPKAKNTAINNTVCMDLLRVIVNQQPAVL